MSSDERGRTATRPARRLLLMMSAPEMIAHGVFFVADLAHRVSGSSSHRPPLRWNWLILPASLAAGLGLWYGLTHPARLPAYLLPGPELVWARFLVVLRDGTLARHTLVSLAEAVSGLALGLVAASILGYFIAKSRPLERALTPYIVASQAIPVVAIAPLLVIWLGFGLRSKILISALIVFFPILVNTVIGVKSVEPTCAT